MLGFDAVPIARSEAVDLVSRLDTQGWRRKGPIFSPHITFNPKAQVIAVQAEKAPGAYLSWKNKKIVIDKMETVTEGFATKMGYELTQEILQD